MYIAVLRIPQSTTNANLRANLGVCQGVWQQFIVTPIKPPHSKFASDAYEQLLLTYVNTHCYYTTELLMPIVVTDPND